MADDGTYEPNGAPLPPGEEDEEDWFGEGSAFDSGEDLAAALFSMAGVSAHPTFSGAEGDGDDDDAFDPEEAPLEFQRPHVATSAASGDSIGLDAFQVVERTAKTTSETPAAWGVRSVTARAPGGSGGTRTSWSMRHSVQFLKMTEEVIKKLRNEAVELTWQVAALGIQQANPPPKSSKR